MERQKLPNPATQVDAYLFDIAQSLRALVDVTVLAAPVEVSAAPVAAPAAASTVTGDVDAEGVDDAMLEPVPLREPAQRKR